MGKGRAMAKVAAIGATVAGVLFFWRKRRGASDAGSPPGAADRPNDAADRPNE